LGSTGEVFLCPHGALVYSIEVIIAKRGVKSNSFYPIFCLYCIIERQYAGALSPLHRRGWAGEAPLVEALGGSQCLQRNGGLGLIIGAGGPLRVRG